MQIFSVRLFLTAMVVSAIGAVPLTPATTSQESALQNLERRGLHNNFGCQSSHNPIVFIHALFTNEPTNWIAFLPYFQSQGFCTFGLTYGAYDALPFVGGLKPINDSAQVVGAFIKKVHEATGKKVNLVGHSEGAFLSLYIPKFVNGTAEVIDKIAAMAPPTRGTDLSSIGDLAYFGGNITRELIGEVLNGIGCPACNDVLVGGPASSRLVQGPIRQPGNEILVLASKNDHIVTPQDSAFVRETGVTNRFIQDECLFDFVGHVGFFVDQTAIGLIHKFFDPKFSYLRLCIPGIPF